MRPLQTKPVARHGLVALLQCLFMFGAISFSRNLSAKEDMAEETTNYGKAWRHEALHRQRRILFDNDGNEALMNCKTIDADELLKARTAALAGSQVDTIYYCSNARSIAEKSGRKRGRPILMSVRVPDSVEYCKAIGLDVETWLRDDLIDILLVAGYFQLNPWEYSVALGHKYGVKVYPSLDESRVRDPAAKQLRSSNLAYRGRAANVWQSGADGVAFFNYFNPNGKLWRECGDYALLKTLDKDYFASVRGKNNAAGGNLPYSDYQQAETLDPRNPKKIVPGKSEVAQIHFGEKWEEDDPVHLEMRLQFNNLKSPDPIKITINGEPVPNRQQEGKWITCSPPRWACREGLNRVHVTLNPTEKDRLVWTDLMLTVRHAD